jgi:hypothetical protein
MKADKFWLKVGLLANDILTVLGDVEPWNCEGGDDRFKRGVVRTYSHLLLTAIEGSRFQREFCQEVAGFITTSLLPNIPRGYHSKLFDIADLILERAHLRLSANTPAQRQAIRNEFDGLLASTAAEIEIQVMLQAAWRCVDDLAMPRMLPPAPGIKEPAS